MNTIRTSISTIASKDRPLLGLCIFILLVTLFIATYGIFLINPNDTQIATKYSAFDETQYYRNQWYYLISFIIFPVFIGILHTILVAKMYMRNMVQYSYGFAVITLVLLLISVFIIGSVFGIAYL